MHSTCLVSIPPQHFNMLDGHTPKPSLEIPHNGSLNSLHGSSLYIGEIRPPSPRSSVGSSWGSPSKPRHTAAQHPRSLNSRKDHPTNLLELNIPPHQPRHFHPTGHTFSGDRSYNYEEKYAQDAPGEEAGQSARVWKTYLDEAESYDDDMLKGFQDTINSLLVLAALFSAVVTTFVIETSQLLRTDYGQVTATLLYEQVQLLRANGNATLLSSVPVSTVNPNSQTWSTTDIVVNGLFFTSLALSLATALLSVLSKQWIQAYTALTSGTAMDRALIRHFRFEGVLKWKLTEFIGSLPLLLHTSLALFLAGLALFVYNLHSSLSWTVSVIAALSFLFYLGSLFLPVLWIDCPFRVPLLYRPMAWIIFAFQYIRYAFKKRFVSSKTYVKPPRPAFSTLKEAELEILSRSRSYDVTELALKSISWLHGLTSNNTVRRVAAQALAGLTFGPVPHRTILKSIATSPMTETAFQGLYDDSDIPPRSEWKSQRAVWARAINWLIQVSGYVESESEGSRISYHYELLLVFMRSARENRLNLLSQALDWGVDIDAVESGRTALQGASEEGHTDIVKLLLEKGANIHISGQDGSPLHLACHGGHLQIIDLLLSKGADPNSQDGGAFGTALRAACFHGQNAVVRKLIANGADVNVHGKGWARIKSGAPLAAACGNGNLDITVHLLDTGALLNDFDEFYDGTALTAASEGGSLAIVTLLLDKGAVSSLDPDKQYNDALLRACKYGHFDIFRLLLERGGDPNASFHSVEPWTWSGTLIQAARFYKRPVFVALLRQYGVKEEDNTGIE